MEDNMQAICPDLHFDEAICPDLHFDRFKIITTLTPRGISFENIYQLNLAGCDAIADHFRPIAGAVPSVVIVRFIQETMTKSTERQHARTQRRYVRDRLRGIMEVD